MKNLLIGSVFLSLAALTGSAQAQQAHQDFTLINATGYDIKEVYVSPSKADNWEEDVLGDDELIEGHQTHIKFTRANKTCKWDLKVVYSEDDSDAVWSDIDLCRVSAITVKWNRKTNVTSAVFE